MANVTRDWFVQVLNKLPRGGDRQNISLKSLHPDLNLSGLDLSKLDLSCVNFSGLNLEHVNFGGCDLYGSIFTNASLRFSIFVDATVGRPPGNHEADWSGADFSHANLTGVDLKNIILVKKGEKPIRFDQAKLIGANLSWQHLEGVSLVGTNLTGAILRYAHFETANLERAVMKGADIEDSDFTGANMRHVNMSGASIGNYTLLVDVDLSGAVLTNLNDKKLSNHLVQGVMGSVNMRNANCTGADMRGLVFPQLNFRKVNFTDADLREADLSKATFVDGIFHGANLCGANISTFNEAGGNNSLQGAKFDRLTKLPVGWFWVQKNGMIRVE